MILTAENDLRLIETEISPDMRLLVSKALDRTRADLESIHPGMYLVHIFEAWRDPLKQWERYMKGRMETHSGNIIIVDRKKVVTAARPEQSAHCVVVVDKPSSLAVDLWVLNRNTRALLPDAHPAWAVIPHAALCVGLRSGAFFSSIPGGDWPHLEHPLWQERIAQDRLQP